MISIYNSVEIDAVARDFKYADYLNLHMQAECLAAVLSEKGYDILCTLFSNEMAEDMKKYTHIEESNQQYGWLSDEERRML